MQNIDFIILLHSTVHKKNLTASTLKKEQPIIDSNCSPVSGFHTTLTLLFLLICTYSNPLKCIIYEDCYRLIIPYS